MTFFIGNSEEEDADWDHELHMQRAIKIYQKLKDKNPDHSLLKFGEIKTIGLIFKKEYFKYSEEKYGEYLKKYGNKKGERYPMPIERYANDLEKALRKN